MKNITEKGFTLVELLIVIAIIAILAGAVVVTINPGEQFAQARNSTRDQHIQTISSGILSYTAGNQGNFPDCLDPADHLQGEEPGDDDFDAEEDGVDVTNCEDYLTPEYITDMPEPQQEQEDEEYRVAFATEDANNIVIWSTSDEWLDRDEED